MVMDECPKKTNDYELIKKSMDLSMYWAERSKKNLDQTHIKPFLELFKVDYLMI